MDNQAKEALKAYRVSEDLRVAMEVLAEMERLANGVTVGLRGKPGLKALREIQESVAQTGTPAETALMARMVRMVKMAGTVKTDSLAEMERMAVEWTRKADGIAKQDTTSPPPIT